MKTKMICGYTALCLILALCGFQFSETPEFLQKLKARLDKYNAAFPEEKVYLQFDKPFYKPGEDIWFNAFVLNSNTHKPSFISDVIYVTLSDPKGNVVSRLDLVVNEGSAKGDFKIGENDPGGIYHVEAYTNWMKNFSGESIFKKELQVQKIITPRLLLKLDFEKEAYGPADTVVAMLNARDLKNELLVNASLSYSASVAGERFTSGKAFTDNKGNLSLKFVLPEKLKSADGLLQIVVNGNGTQESISRSIPIVLNNIKIAFFPEGGNFAEGRPCRVAFKALNEFGKAADVAGIIVDDRGNSVTTFSSFHMGIGAFHITPLAGMKYFARITSPINISELTPLPQAQPYAYTMNISGRSDTSVEFAIQSPAEVSAYLVGLSHGELYYSEKIKLATGANTISVNTSSFPSGIAVFTLFKEPGTPVCERLVFVNHDKQLNIRLTTSKPKYLPGEKVELKIETTDPFGKPVPAKLALSVADDQLITFADDKQDNLLSSMLLSSEVKGEIQEPSFYFDSNEPKSKEALDYLLMTQGWRRFQLTELDQAKTLAFNAEKVKTVNGSILSKDGKAISDEVMLVELGNRKRIITLKTTEDGAFSFRNIDPTVPIMLLAGKNSQFEIDYNKEEYQQQRQKTRRERENANIVMMPDEEREQDAAPEEVLVNNDMAFESDLNLEMNEDVQALSEVVVIGYGVEQRRDVTGSIAVVTADEPNTLMPLPGFEQHLQGRVAGVQVQPAMTSPGAASKISIRGNSSIGSGSSEPLFVINGVPIGTSINYNFSNSSLLAANDIESIQIMHSPEASAMFGSAAANGAIVITTKSKSYYPSFDPRPVKPKFSSIVIQPRKFSPTREFYASVNNSTTTRGENVNTTVYWNPEIITNEKGVASITFTATDAISAFRMTAEGFSQGGLLGHAEEVYSTLLPVSVDAKLPAFLGFEDILKIPVRVTNETEGLKKAMVSIDVPDGLELKEQRHNQTEVKPHESVTLIYTLKPQNKTGKFPILIKVSADGRTDQIAQTIDVKPVGFPMRASFSGKDLERNVRFRITEAEKGTLHAEFNAFPDVLSDLFAGAEGIFCEPYGCFEQTSSSTFPNILALQYLQRSGQIKGDIEQKALGYIRTGYKRLISYEVKGGGFEWFGHAPAHEALTAYGLIEFVEMKKVFPEVNENMINRTREWLLSRRKSNGSFELQSHGMDDFSRPSGDVSNMYITYALSETGTKDLRNEFEYNLQRAYSSDDMYQLALMANIAYNLGRRDEYNKLINLFESKVLATHFESLYASHSIVWSQGSSLSNETVALWALAFMKDGMTKMNSIKACIDYIVGRRSNGMFGSTQATVLSLKALSEYAVLARSTQHEGEITLFVNEAVAQTLGYKKQSREKLVINDFVKYLTSNGEQRMKIKFDKTPEALPYSVNIFWNTKVPAASQNCKVKIETTLNASKVRLNETVRLNVSVTNRQKEGLPMTMAIIGIPAGLSAQPWQLKELQERGTFDFYEINDNYIYVYYRQMKPQEVKRLSLDMKAEIPGVYTGAASSAYLYYADEDKDWVKGNRIEVVD